MKEKLNLQEIIDQLSRETGATKKDSEIFLRNFFSLITETLLQDKIVKIKGIGTFKLIQVEKRESVNVNTKEKYEIPAHHKLSFIPDAGMKELVNEPFSAFEPVEVYPENTTTEKQTIQEEEKTEAKTTKTNTIEEAKENTPQKEEEIKNEIEQPEPATTKKKEFKNKKDAQKSRLNAIILFLTIGIIAVMGYQWITRTIEEQKAIPTTTKITNHHIKKTTTETTVPEPNNKQDKIQQNTPEIKTQEQQTTEKNETTVETPTQQTTTKLLDKIILEEGNRLTLIAEKYYGHKVFWVYLYEANKTRIKNPNNIPVGTLIEIPLPETYDINVQNPESIRKASDLSAKIIETFN